MVRLLLFAHRVTLSRFFDALCMAGYDNQILLEDDDEELGGGQTPFASSDEFSMAGSVVVKVNNGTFTWDETGNNPTLDRIDFEAKQGQLVVVIGHVGSGKCVCQATIIHTLWRFVKKRTLRTDPLCCQHCLVR
jgi:ABC-type multidrug transport system fused ATPase/permease subunit